MEYKVEDLSPVEKKITVTVPTEEVNAALLATTALYRRSADVKGFRKGKVPSSVVESRFRKQIVGEATTDLINLHLNEILSELKAAPLGGINVENGELEKDAEFTYTFSFEIPPALELPNYKGLEVEEEDVVVDEKEVDAVVERIRDNMAELKDVDEPREPKDGDVVTVAFAAMGDASFEGIRADNFQLTLGRGEALGEFEELVKTLKPGEKGSKEISFPEDFINETLAGKTAEMHVHVKSLKERVLPEMDDALAKKAGGFDTVEKLREAIRGSYVNSRKQLTRSAAQKKLLDGLLEGMEIALPPSMVGRNVEFKIGELRERLERRGKSLESHGKTMEQLREEFTPAAEEMARAQVFLMAVANAEGLTVQPQEVDAVLRDLSMRTGQDFDSLKQYHEQTGLSVVIKDRIITDKAIDLIYQNAKVTVVPPAESAKAEEASGEAEA